MFNLEALRPSDRYGALLSHLLRGVDSGVCATSRPREGLRALESQSGALDGRKSFSGILGNYSQKLVSIDPCGQ